MRTISDATKAAAIADYKRSRSSYAAVAARHGVSQSVLHSWVNPTVSKPRGAWRWSEKDLALTGGRWVNVRGVMRWESFLSAEDQELTVDERRVKYEDAMFDEDESRMLHARYAAGCREDRTVVGERVYQRRKKRSQYAAKKEAA